ncbi:PF20097 family protein [Alkaliphilus transvaalensis]|uniref:PF20097 family protein n=1 Tax=Alkaliphilus transvaalensis TaxID=114628 RepID=UPI00047A9CDB|nr:PF20097 family protein [Alkaliphilus transvaalensis]
MEKIKCNKCGKENIVKGNLQHSGSVLFVPQDQKGLYVKKASGIIAHACKDCGCVFDLTLENPEKI